MCTSCAKGTYQTGDGVSSCTLCSPGKFTIVIQDVNNCVDCSTGTYATQAGATACDTCIKCTENGYYRSKCGGASNGTCELCN
jgi:hypothetical protein